MAKVAKVTEYSKAKEALAKKKDEWDKASVKAESDKASVQDKAHAKRLEEDYMADRKKVMRLGFVQIAQIRTVKAHTAIRALNKLANKRAYSFTHADVEKIKGVLSEDLAALDSVFHSALAGPISEPARQTQKVIDFD